MPLHESVRDLYTPQYRAAMEATAEAPALWKMEAAEARAVLASQPAPTAGMQTAHKVEDTTVPRADGSSVPVRVWTPLTAPPAGGFPAVIYFHGGGWTIADVDKEAVQCSNLSARGDVVVVSVEYRLAPEHPYPAAPDDAIDTYKWMVANASRLNLNPERIAAAGGSAGGNLAAVLTHRVLNRNRAGIEKLPTIKANVLMVPTLDVDARAYWTAERYQHVPELPPEFIDWFGNNYYVGHADKADPDVSPMNAPAENFEQYPPTLIATAETDVLRGQSEAYAAKLMRHGRNVTFKMYKGVGHFFMLMPGLSPEADQLLLDISRYIRQVFYEEPSIDVKA